MANKDAPRRPREIETEEARRKRRKKKGKRPGPARQASRLLPRKSISIRFGVWAAAFAVFVLAGALLFYLLGQSGAPGAPSSSYARNETLSAAVGTSVGDVAPDFGLYDYDGGAFNLSAQRGRKVLLVFFATWCPYCNAEAPLIKEAAAGNPGVSVVYVNDNMEDAAAIYSFARKHGLSCPALLDLGGGVPAMYGVTRHPSHFLIGADGRIIYKAYGQFASAAEVEGVLSLQAPPA